jgi:pilus assembly protein CpaF
MTASAAVDELCRRVRHVPGDVEEVVRAHALAVAPLAATHERDAIVAAAVARLTGLDALGSLLDDPTVDEVLVNRSTEVWIERGGALERGPDLAPGALDVIVERVLTPIGRRLDRSSPIVDARLPDGARVCAVGPPVAVDGTCLSIRRLRTRHLPLAAFATADVAGVIRQLVQARCNVVVVGATSSGKTSLLAALVGIVDERERIVVLEDTTELDLPHPHVVRLEARHATVDGVAPVTLDELVRAAMRLRPDRLVVGEVRGPEVLALAQALNTGHDGSLSTCHANGTIDALHRLETLVLQAAPAWPLAAVRASLTRSIDVVVLVARGHGAERRVVEVAEVVAGDGPPGVRVLADGDRVLAQLHRGRS